MTWPKGLPSRFSLPLPRLSDPSPSSWEARLAALRSAIPAKAELLSLAASKPIADNDTPRVADLIDDLINDS